MFVAVCLYIETMADVSPILNEQKLCKYLCNRFLMQKKHLSFLKCFCDSQILQHFSVHQFNSHHLSHEGLSYVAPQPVKPASENIAV